MRNDAPVPPSDPPQSIEASCHAIYEELRGLLDHVLRSKGVPVERARPVDLNLAATLDPGAVSEDERREESRAFTERLLADLRRIAQDEAGERTPFPVGFVRCFWCDSSTCEHALPPEPRAVFRGYSPTGQPLWKEFAALALECHHPHIEHVYRERGAPITLTQPGSSLTRDQLGVYGKHSNAYRILGQVLTGYIRVKRSRLALTIQAVQTEHRTRRFHLNVIGVRDDGEPVGPGMESLLDARVLDALASARAKLEELALTKHGRGGRRAGFHARERDAMRVLTRLARNLDRIHRQRSRRTQHGEERHADRERPASSALRDALKADASSIYRDVEEQTWVVVGPRNRVHVFNDRAQHVTSVVYSGETIRKRTTQGKWRRGEDDALVAFREQLRRH